jgi:hypothetical protein
VVIRYIPALKRWRLYSKETHRNLGTYRTKAGAVQREKQVQWFKYHKK